MLLFVVLTCFVVSTEVFARNNVVFDNGTISFAPVPTSTGGFSPITYDDRGLGGYYAMANGFVDVVRSGSLPYDELIIPQLNAVNDALVNPNTSPYEPNVQELVQIFLTWYAGIIAVTVLGFVLAFCMPLACLIVCCCRLCNQCGGNLSWSVEEEDKEKKKRICCIVLFAFLLVFLALVFVGMVFAFLTNEAVQDTVDNVVPTVLNTLDNVGAFTTDALKEASFLVVDQLNFTLNLVVNEATDLNSSIVQPLIQMNRPQVDSLFNGIFSINDSLNSVSAALDDIVDNVTALNLTAGNISEQVVIVREQLTNLSTECMSNGMLNASSACANIPNPSSIQNVDVSSQVNQVLSEIDNFRQSLSLGQNLTEIVNLINGTINDIPSLVQDAVGNRTDSIRESVTPAVNNISQGLEGAKTAVNNIFNNSDPNSVLYQIRNVYVPQYVLNEEIPYSLNRLSLGRYIVGLLFCIVALLVIVAVCLGLICGVAGFNKHRLPYERTSLSNCGGICLLVSAALIFLAGFILLILAAIMFPFGSTLRKFCLAVQDPEYEVYGRILDNGDIWGNPPLGSLISRVTGDPTYSSLDVRVRDVFSNCERNAPLYSALNGDEVLNGVNISIQGQSVNLGRLVMDPTSILDVFNISISSLTGQLDTALEGVNLTGIIPRDTIDQLTANLPNVSAFEFSSQIDTLRTSIMDANSSLTDAQMNVTTLRVNATALNATGVANQADAILMTINTTQSLLNTASSQVDDLEASIVRAQMAGDDAVNATRVQVNQSLADAETLVTAFTDSLFMIVNGTVSNTVGYVTQYGSYILNALRNDALRCGPLSNIYVGTMNLVCRQTVNSMNGFWFSMGWCALFFIPLVAFVIALSKHFRRHKDVDEILRNAEYTENGYQLETYYNPSVANTVANNHQHPMGTEGNFTKAKFDDSYPLFEDPRSGAGQTDDYWISNQNGEM